MSGDSLCLCECVRRVGRWLAAVSEPVTNTGCHFCVSHRLQLLNENVADRKGSNKMLENDLKKRGGGYREKMESIA